MKPSLRYNAQGPGGKVAVLWDESFLWGVMAHKALVDCGLPFDLVRSADVKRGRLRDYDLLFVPGGWASNKMKSLGNEGVEAIQRFVSDGGTYLGFCGGAGLATEDGIGLLPVKRRPTKDRVPSFSGRITLTTADHPLWQGVSHPIFHAWWPSQFVVDEKVTVLAVYGGAMPDSFSSDVNVGDAEAAHRWTELERIYGINLDPKRLLDEPAVIEGPYGKGRVLLSLVHFDTPDDVNGATVLKNAWSLLASPGSCEQRSTGGGAVKGPSANEALLVELEETMEDLIALGQRNFLWFWRNPLLLQWRRGVRGLEYCTLHVMVKKLADLLRRKDGRAEMPGLDHSLERTRDLLLSFVEKAKQLLVRERFAMQNAHITYERCDDPEIQALREELFSRAKSHGGLFKSVIDAVDTQLYSALIRR